MARDPHPTHFFVLAVIRRGARFLLVQEKKYGQTWTVPGGRVEPGESWQAAALREIREEAGVDAILDGVIRIEHDVSPHGPDHRVRLRVLFHGTAADAPNGGDPITKTIPDDESLGAAWLTLAEIRARPPRGGELVALLEAIERGDQPIYPLAVIGDRELFV